MVAGVFDSGVGGLTVVKSLLNSNLFSRIIYYGDTARVPYGSKDKNTIIRYSLEALEFFENFNIDILITACNSVSAYAIDELKSSSKTPVVGVIEAGVLALNRLNLKRDSTILIIGTKATIDSNKYERLLRSYNYSSLKSIATPLFVPIVEESLFSTKILDETIKHYFKDIDSPDVLILGCTHFPLISSELSNYFKDTLLIHSGDAIVEHLKQLGYSELNISKDRVEIDFFATENPKGLKEIAKKWLFINF